MAFTEGRVVGEEFCRVNAEGVGQREDSVDCRAVRRVLDPVDRLAVDPDLVGQVLLRPPAVLPEPSHCVAEQGAAAKRLRVRGRHRRSLSAAAAPVRTTTGT